MNDLINREELLSEMEEYYERRSEEANMSGNRSACVTWNDAVMLIKNASTEPSLAEKIVELTDQGFDIRFGHHIDVIYPGEYIAVFVYKGKYYSYQKILIDHTKIIEDDVIFTEALEKSKNDINEYIQSLQMNGEKQNETS